MKRKISIIIPTIRVGGLLEFQLKGFAKQTLSKEYFEIIIVDDYIDVNGNNRKEIVEEFGRNNNLNIKWVRGKTPYWRCNANIGNARNTGLIYAEGELVVFIDDYSWIKPDYLSMVWDIYKNTPGYSHIGPIVAIEYLSSGSDYPEDLSKLKFNREDERIKQMFFYGIDKHFRELIYKDCRHEAAPCNPGWFYTSNASAPLDLIVKVNGFWELADLTREEDILMGLTLERIGWKFCFVNDPNISVYHMAHDYPELDMNSKGNNINKKYHDVTYESICWPTEYIGGRDVCGGGVGGKNGLCTNPDCIQLVTKDVFNTAYPGSWALIEHFKKNPGLIFNKEEVRTQKFDLAEERRKVGLL